MKGWLKLYREIQDSTPWQTLTNEGRLVMIAILLNCNYKDSEVLIEGQLRTIQPGQWLTSIPKIKESARVTDQNVRTALKVLKKTKFLTEEVTDGNHRIITVIDWVLYQGGNGVTDEITDGQQTANRRLTDEVTESKEGLKNLRREEGKELNTNTLSASTDDIKVIFDFWNEQPKLIHHAKLTDKQRTKIKSALKDYSLSEIQTAIGNYNTVLSRPDEYFFSYKWTIQDFMSRGLEKFLAEAEPLKNMLREREEEEVDEFERFVMSGPGEPPPLPIKKPLTQEQRDELDRIFNETMGPIKEKYKIRDEPECEKTLDECGDLL